MAVAKTKTGVNLEDSNLKYLDKIREKPPFNKISRSALINLIIDEHRQGQGTPLFAAVSSEGVNGTPGR